MVPVRAGETVRQDVQVERKIDRQPGQRVQSGEVRRVADPDVRLQTGQAAGACDPAAAAEQVLSESAFLVIRVVVEEHQGKGLPDPLQPEERLVVVVARSHIMERVQRQPGELPADPVRAVRRTITICALEGGKICKYSLHGGVKIGKIKIKPYIC